MEEIIIGLLIGIVITYFFTASIMKNKIALVKADAEKEIKDELILLEKEKSRLSERVLRIDELEEELARKEEEVQAITELNTRLEKRIAELETMLKKEREATAEKLELLEKAKEEMKSEFKNLSNEILEEKSKRFTELNKENISGILDPLKKEFNEFKHRVDEVYKNDSNDRVALKTQIESLRELNEKLGKEASSLTNALKSDTKKQGAWGEVILERVLEESGLQKGIEYELQASFTDNDRKRKRPDAIVHLPNKKDVIIDSKVSITAYQKFNEAENEDEKKQYLKEHLQSIKKHISELSQKNYDDIEELYTLDYVLMFIPIESAFMLAMENNRELFSEAFEKNIVIVTPTTLLVTLKTIHNIWRYEKQSKNAQEIAKRAGDLYDKFVGFTDSLLAVGDSLDKAKNSYELAINRLKNGRGNLISQAEKMKKLGIKSKKVLSVKLTNELTEENLIDYKAEEE